MTVTGLRELEEVAVKLEAKARKLPMGPIRDELLQDIAIFRAQVAALQAAALRPSGEGLKARGNHDAHQGCRNGAGYRMSSCGLFRDG